MSGYHPPQRAIRAALLTGARWIAGTFHVPRRNAFDDYLARGRPFFTLTDVELGPGGPRPFLALRASAAHAIVPSGRPEGLLLVAPPDARPREVTCYLERVTVRGALVIRPNVRTSDFLAHQEGFITLRDARFTPELPGRPGFLPAVFVNARAVIAVAETGEDPADLAAPTPVPGALAAGRAPARPPVSVAVARS